MELFSAEQGIQPFDKSTCSKHGNNGCRNIKVHK